MTKVPGVKYKEVGNLYGLRNWVEYGLKQTKNELGWADFRVTNYAQIQKWWEVVMSAYLLVSLHSSVLNPSDHSSEDNTRQSWLDKFSTHDWWDEEHGWKNLLNIARISNPVNLSHYVG
jgi:SRSO17 transposase